jgi:flagellar hook-length control protein FliK
MAAQLASPLPPQDAAAGQSAQAPVAPAPGSVPAGAVVPGTAGLPAGVPGQPVPGAPGTADPNAVPGTPADAAQAAPTGPQADAPAQPAAPKLAVPFNLDAAQTAPQASGTAAQATAPAQAPAGAARADKPQDAAPVVQGTTTTQPLTPPVAAPAQPLSAPAGLQRAVPLGHVARTMGTLLHVAAERGVTHARLNLKPVELGGIEVRLQSTPQGVSAQLVADSPEAARMLTQASDDLRRQLADRNVNLLSLDVSTSSDQRQASAGASAGNDGGFGEARSGGSSATSRSDDGDAQATEAAPAETTLVLPGGVLVDVLA